MSNNYKIIDEKFESSKGAMRSYVIGFVLSIIATLIPYCMVTRLLLGPQSLIIATSIFGVAQLIIQVVFFLHLHPKSRPRWNMIVFTYTILIVMFLVIGSLWIMYHLNMNMMGTSPFHSNEGYVPSFDKK